MNSLELPVQNLEEDRSPRKGGWSLRPSEGFLLLPEGLVTDRISGTLVAS